jgi:hypothetical protein
MIISPRTGEAEEERRTVPRSVQQEVRICPTCGTKFFTTADRGSCPVCILRGAVGGEPAATEQPGSVSESADSAEEVRRFENYEMMLDNDGRPIELGRGAMGVTYKALDVDLRCPVTLKVISERYLGDELARLRFLREARAAASVRHPNVASVLYLGRTGSSYFYAMEFVEGETLEHLMKRSGRVEVKLALEIATQVAAGLAAVHKQKIVHRDIKPSNMMVSFEEGGGPMVKINALLRRKFRTVRAHTKLRLPLKPTKKLKITLETSDANGNSSTTSESFIAEKDGKLVIPVPVLAK